MATNYVHQNEKLIRTLYFKPLTLLTKKLFSDLHFKSTEHFIDTSIYIFVKLNITGY